MTPVQRDREVVVTRFFVGATAGLLLGAAVGGMIGASYWAIGLAMQDRLWDALHGYALDGYGVLWGVIELGCVVGGVVGLICGAISGAFPPLPPTSTIALPPGTNHLEEK